MKLKVEHIDNKGPLGEECICFRVLENIDDLSDYMVCPKTLTGEAESLNGHQVYWFPKIAVKADDTIKLTIGFSSNIVESDIQNRTTYCFFWHLESAVWTQEKNHFMLVNLDAWQTVMIQ